MSSAFDADFAAANDLLAEAFGGEVTLVRGSTETSGVTAQMFINKYEGENDEGLTETIQVNDFVLDRSDYAFGSGEVEPRCGDRIKLTIDSVEHTFEVLPIPNGKTHEWADASGDEWLIHTRHIEP